MNPIISYQDKYGQTIDFHIKDRHNKFCVNVSGGADSACLMYLLIKYCQKYIPDAEIYVITCANVVKGWYNARVSSVVIDRLLQLTRTDMIKGHYTYFADDQIRTELNNFEETIYKLYGTTYFIHGTTQNPDRSVVLTRSGGHTQRDNGHNRPILRSNYMFGNEETYRYMPFMHVDKRMISHLYKEKDLLTELLPYTRSCEQHRDENKENPWMSTPCGECWWCREREWAFRR